MENETIIIQFKKEKQSIPIPDSFENLQSQFMKFNIEDRTDYDFYFLKNRTERINLKDLFRYDFKEKISLFQEEEEPIIYIEEHNPLSSSYISSQIPIENKDENNIQKNINFINEINKCEEIIGNIIDGKQSIVFPSKGLFNIRFGKT